MQADPWAFGTSPYEAEKYAATLAALTRPRYRRALEIGCANGALRARLGFAVETGGRLVHWGDETAYPPERRGRP